MLIYQFYKYLYNYERQQFLDFTYKYDWISYTFWKKKTIDLEVKVKVTRSAKMTLKRKIIKIFDKLG